MGNNWLGILISSTAYAVSFMVLAFSAGAFLNGSISILALVILVALVLIVYTGVHILMDEFNL